MANAPNTMLSPTTRRLLLGLSFSFAAFVLWLIPSYVVMSPDTTYAERVLREAELVAAAIARGGMARRPSSKIGDPRDPRIIEAKKRSPFNKNKAEGIMRQMRTIVNKRIVLYDHRRRIVLDSYNFDQANRVNARAIPEPELMNKETKKNLPPFNYLPPPHGDNKFVLTALGGKTIAREITPSHAKQTNYDRIENAKTFKPKQPILLAAAPVRRLKLVQGAVVLIDNNPQERAQWRWRSLLQDSASVFAAIFVAFVLLLLWLKGAFVNPLARLAYSAEGTESKYNDEFAMLNHRQELGQLAARNFAYTTKFLKDYRQKTSEKNKQELFDSEMSALVHNTLGGAKLEVSNLAHIVQQVVNRQNIREHNLILRKVKKINGAELPYKNKVQLTQMESNGHRNSWQLPLFAKSLELCLDYLIQAAALAQVGMWENSVRLSLVRHNKTIDIIIEDDGEDIPASTLDFWLNRNLSNHTMDWTKASLEKTIAMHSGKLSIPSLRPPRLKLTLPVSPKK